MITHPNPYQQPKGGLCYLMQGLLAAEAKQEGASWEAWHLTIAHPNTKMLNTVMGAQEMIRR